jgi:hypothetical protein
VRVDVEQQDAGENDDGRDQEQQELRMILIKRRMG